jgi:hypothetical protein
MWIDFMLKSRTFSLSAMPPRSLESARKPLEICNPLNAMDHFFNTSILDIIANAWRYWTYEIPRIADICPYPRGLHTNVRQRTGRSQRHC